MTRSGIWLKLFNWLPAISSGKKAAKRPSRRRLLLEALEDRVVPSASLWTDKLDYAPGETAVIGGSGFQAGETVQLQVVRTDGVPDYPQGNVPWRLTDGGAGDLDGRADGNIQTAWHVESQYLGASLLATATGLDSGETASAAFTDADTIAPTTTLTFPAAGGVYSSASWTGSITGAANDTGGSGLDHVEVSIQRDSTGLYWGGSSFNQVAETFITAAGTSSWSLAFAAANFPADGSYTVHARAVDVATNVGANAAATFTIDTAGPTTTLTFPSAGVDYSSPSWTGAITGTASDTGGSGLDHVEVSVRRASTGLYWNGSSFNQASETFITVAGTASWSLAFPAANFPADGSYTVHARAVDVATNVGANAAATFTIDNAGPTTSNVSVSPSPANAAPTVTALVSDSSSGNSDITAAEFFIDTVGANGSGTAMAATDSSFNSPSENVSGVVSGFVGLSEGTHTVFVHGQDAAGNWGPTTTTTFVKDTVAPTISAVSAAPTLISPNGDGVNDTTTISYTLSEASTVTIKIYNSSNVLVRTLVNGGSRLAGINLEAWNGKNNANVVVPDGVYIYRIEATDATGNAATLQSGTLTVDSTPPMTSISFTPIATGVWWIVNAQVTLTASDPGGSGVASTFYQIDGGPLTIYRGPFTVSGTAIHAISYYSTDNAGNTESAQTRTTAAAPVKKVAKKKHAKKRRHGRRHR